MVKKTERNVLARTKPAIFLALVIATGHTDKIMPPKANHFARTKGEDSMPTYIEALGKVIAPDSRDLHKGTLAEAIHN